MSYLFNILILLKNIKIKKYLIPGTLGISNADRGLASGLQEKLLFIDS